MTSTPYVARCSICGVAPFSEDDPKSLGYTLKRFPDGQLYCQAHYPPKIRALRSAPVSPRDVLDELEKALATQIETLNDAVAEAVEDAVAEAVKALTGKALSVLTDEQREIIEEIIDEGNAADNALDEFRGEFERALGQLRKAIAAQAARDEKTVQPKRMKPPTLVGLDKAQADLIANSGEREEDAS